MTDEQRQAVGHSYCANCGNQLEAGAGMCPWCKHEVVVDNGLPSSANGPSTQVVAPQHQASVVKPPTIEDTTIVLGDGEKVWKRYAVSYLPGFELFGIRLSRPAGTGTLFVTNSRVLFLATHRRRGKRSSRLVQETRVQLITGVSAFVTRRSGWLAPLVILVCGLLALIALARGSAGKAIVLLVIAAVAYTIGQRLGERRTVGVVIHSSQSEVSPLSFGQVGESGGLRALLALFAPLARLLSSGAQDARDLQIAPAGPQAEQVVNELGALIADLQSKGDLAGTHWGVGL
jgi:hypothetical protein